MDAILLAWLPSAAFIAAICALAGQLATKRIDGLLIDSRGRYSLAHLQVVLWTTLVLSLVLGRFLLRRTSDVDEFGRSIPAGLLEVLGVSLGSGVISVAIKSIKDRVRADNVAASLPFSHPDTGSGVADELIPRFVQVFTREEGALADRVVDVTKFQNLIVTYAVAVIYLASALRALVADRLARLPDVSQGLIMLLIISHAAYLLGKLPPQSGSPALSVNERDSLLAPRQEIPRLRRRSRRPGSSSGTPRRNRPPWRSSGKI